MANVTELIRIEENGSISFGNYALTEKTKLSDFEYQGDIYKVKTFREITKLEKNGMLVYESEPGTAVNQFAEAGDGVSFQVECGSDAQIILGMEEETEYQVSVNGADAGVMKTNMGGKLVLSVEMESDVPTQITVKKN